MTPAVFDADSHVFEPTEIWTEHLDPAYRTLARSSFWYELDATGVASVILNGRPGRPLGRSRLVRQAIWRPGMTPEQIGALDPEAPPSPNPGAWDAAARLEDMDALGIERALVFPTLFGEYLPVVENPDVARALASAYNDWVAALCSAAPGRLYAAAVLPLQDAGFALAETRRCAAAGFRCVFLRPAFFEGRYLNDRYYDPLWKELEALELAAFVHASPGSTNPEGTSQGAFIERVGAHLHVGHDLAEAAAPTMDNALAFTALLMSGHFETYPRLRLAFAHGGASWLPLALEKAETYLTLGGPTYEDITLEPEEVFFQRPSLLTFDSWDTSVARIPDLYGRVAAWGSRYPHHDASAPTEVLAELERADVPDDVIANLLGGNLARLLGLDA